VLAQYLQGSHSSDSASKEVKREVDVLRITHSGYMQVATIDLDGKLVGPWVDELRRTIEALRRDDAIHLNLAKLTFADAAGLSLLHALRRDGVGLVGTLPLIAGLLASHIDREAREPSATERA
jgi:anti-anti-sigma regulatory factor